LGTALEWLEKKNRKAIGLHEAELTTYALSSLKEVEGLEMYGTGEEDQLGVISFNLAGIHAHDTVQFLAAKKLALRAGHHCAQPLIKKLGVPSTVRASLAVYNEAHDVERLVDALKSTRDFFIEKGVL
jgi:cysteine desulfurase / selenocysteine lyase